MVRRRPIIEVSQDTFEKLQRLTGKTFPAEIVSELAKGYRKWKSGESQPSAAGLQPVEGDNRSLLPSSGFSQTLPSAEGKKVVVAEAAISERHIENVAADEALPPQASKSEWIINHEISEVRTCQVCGTSYAVSYGHGDKGRCPGYMSWNARKIVEKARENTINEARVAQRDRFFDEMLKFKREQLEVVKYHGRVPLPGSERGGGEIVDGPGASASPLQLRGYSRRW